MVSASPKLSPKSFLTASVSRGRSACSNFAQTGVARPREANGAFQGKTDDILIPIRKNLPVDLNWSLWPGHMNR
jgi:hypothetical protein